MSAAIHSQRNENAIYPRIAEMQFLSAKQTINAIPFLHSLGKMVNKLNRQQRPFAIHRPPLSLLSVSWRNSFHVQLVNALAEPALEESVLCFAAIKSPINKSFKDIYLATNNVAVKVKSNLTLMLFIQSGLNP